METLIFDYREGKQVEFLLSGDLMINATEMGAVFGVKPYEFTRRAETQKVIEAMKKRAIGDKKGADFTPFLSLIADLPPENVIKCVNGTPILAIKPGREGATYMHRWLAIDFAMYLDVEFKLWVLEKIDMLFVAFSKTHREIVKEENQLKAERQKLIDGSKDNPTALKIATIDDRLKEIQNEKRKATNNQYKIWNL